MQRLLFLALAMFVLAGAAQARPTPTTPTPNRAGVVVLFGDGHTAQRCVTFTEPTISGYELLRRSGLRMTADTAGGAATVCKIETEGCAFPSESCFCECKGGAFCRYWAYWHVTANGWVYSNLGASSYQVQPGGVDGWAWGNGSVSTGARPPAVTFAQICPAPTTVPPTPTRGKASPTATRGKASPTATPGKAPPTATPRRAAPRTGDDANTTVWGYATFGSIFGGLLIWSWRIRRRNG